MTTLDFFAKHQSLTNAWQWVADYPTFPGATNVSVLANWQDDLGCATNPPMMFFKVQDRTTCAATMTDSDGDGLTDAEEIAAGTDLKNQYSFYRRVTVVTDATDELLDTTNYVAWGTSATGWETNGMSCCWTFPSTNVYDMMSSSGPMYVKSFRDFNRNGQYDPEADIILIEQVPISILCRRRAGRDE